MYAYNRVNLVEQCLESSNWTKNTTETLKCLRVWLLTRQNWAKTLTNKTVNFVWLLTRQINTMYIYNMCQFAARRIICVQKVNSWTEYNLANNMLVYFFKAYTETQLSVFCTKTGCWVRKKNTDLWCTLEMQARHWKRGDVHRDRPVHVERSDDERHTSQNNESVLQETKLRWWMRYRRKLLIRNSIVNTY